MKNITKEALEAYTTLLRYSQLAVNKQISFRNVDLSTEAHIHEIYTLNTSQQELPHLVLLHGFAGSAMSYIRTFQSLSKHFKVHALDHFGNGFSTRPEYDKSISQSQILNLYVNSIQSWRINIGIQKFVLAGHSFGGYLAALYMLQHQNNVDRLILLSPVGTGSQKQINEQILSRKGESLKNKLGMSLIEKVYNMNITPSKLFSTPLIGDILVNQFLKSIIKLQQEEKTMWKSYIKYISIQQSHMQKSFYDCFQWPFVAKMTSISQILTKICENQKQKSIQFYYGENDWTDKISAQKLHAKYSNVNFQIVPKATHNMIFDFPLEVADRIIKGPLNLRTSIL